MIPRNRIRPLFALTVVTALLAAFASLAGILRPRLYLPFTPETLLPGAMSQDIVSFLAALGLLVCLWSIRRGAQRAWLVWASLNGYLFYAYALDSFEQVYNPLYPVYIALTGLTLYSILFFFVWMDTEFLMRLDASRLPRRAIAAYLLLLVAMFVTVWLSLILPGIASQTPPDGASIFVMDLAFFLPLLVIIAVLLLRDRPLGASADAHRADQSRRAGLQRTAGRIAPAYVRASARVALGRHLRTDGPWQRSPRPAGIGARHPARRLHRRTGDRRPLAATSC